MGKYVLVIWVCIWLIASNIFILTEQIQMENLKRENENLVKEGDRLEKENDMLTKSCGELADAYHDMVREEVKKMNVEECGDTECIEKENE